MEIVFIFWSMLFAIVVVQVLAIVKYVRQDEIPVVNSEYSEEVIKTTAVVLDALKESVIKKHIITNSAEQYDSNKMLKQYRNFLSSNLMNDVMSMDEERYDG